MSTLITFVVYFVGMITVGVWVYRRTTNLSDFVLGGRSLNSWVAALSAQASDFSGWLLLGLPGAAYVGGLGAAWIAIGLAIGVYLNWRMVAARLRDYTELATDITTGKAGDALTLSAYFENRFEDPRLLRATSALVIIVFYCVYVSSGLVAAGILFEQVFGLSAVIAMTIGVAAIVIYTFLGGFLAVSYTDAFQGALMWLALIVVPTAAIAVLGGFDQLSAALEAESPALLTFTAEATLMDGEWTLGESLGAVAIISGLAWGLGYFGQPHILARFMGIRSSAAVPKARIIGVTWAITAMAAAMLVGLVGIAFFETPLADPESVFLALVESTAAPWVAGVLLAAVLAAIMSTADSQLLVASAALTEDVYRAFFNRDAGPGLLVWVGRSTVIGVALVAYLLALQGGTVLEIVAYAWAGFGAAFGPLIVLSLFWRGLNRIGALAGMVAGAVTALVYPFIDTIELYEMVPGVAASLAAIVVFNRFGPAPTAGMLADFEKVQAVRSEPAERA